MKKKKLLKTNIIIYIPQEYNKTLSKVAATHFVNRTAKGRRRGKEGGGGGLAQPGHNLYFGTTEAAQSS